jgi:hypothetical protein
MAERPVFMPSPRGPELVEEILFDIVWNSGFAPVQKEKNIKALHEAAAHAGYGPLLEVSTKSEKELGRHLSSFHLKVQSKQSGELPLECAFQGSKVFEGGGPYTDLYRLDPKSAKRDLRLRESGSLIGFSFDGFSFPLEPKTAFYDWLYTNAIFPHREWLKRLSRYAGFTDIEFNPSRSINCQARSCALFVTLMRRDLLPQVMPPPEAFIGILSQHSYGPELREVSTHDGLFRPRINGRTREVTR